MKVLGLCFLTIVNFVFVVLSYSNCCIVVFTCVFRQELSMITFSNFMLRASGTL
jgi:hypothetical protein